MVRAVFFNDAFTAAFKHAEALCSNDKNKIKEIVLVIPAMANLKGSTSLATFLGAEATTALNKGETAMLSGVPITLKTERTLSGLTPNALVICAYAGQSMMDKVDGFGRVAGVIALPFAKDVINGWACWKQYQSCLSRRARSSSTRSLLGYSQISVELKTTWASERFNSSC